MRKSSEEFLTLIRRGYGETYTKPAGRKIRVVRHDDGQLRLIVKHQQPDTAPDCIKHSPDNN